MRFLTALLLTLAALLVAVIAFAFSLLIVWITKINFILGIIVFISVMVLALFAFMYIGIGDDLW